MRLFTGFGAFLLLLPFGTPASAAPAFDPADATYPLGGCADLGTPPLVQLRDGHFAVGPADQPSVEIESGPVLRGDLGGDHAAEIVVPLTCTPWGANYNLVEYFIFDQDGHPLARIDQDRRRQDFTDTFQDTETLWTETRDAAIEGGDLVLHGYAGGFHACPEWAVTLHYGIGPDGLLQFRGPAVREPTGKAC